MNDELNPYEPPSIEDGNTAPRPDAMPPGETYRPWSRGRVYMTFILGMHSAGFMMFFLHPVFALIGLGFGIPAMILANKEIDEFPQAAAHPFVKWGRITGKIGVIGGPIVVVLWVVIAIVAVALGLSRADF
jgi:hypothetical protein